MNKNPIPSVSVLFVDDEEKARKYFALALASDFDVKTAGSAAEAMDILGQHAGQIAIIVSDQRMPEKSGVELLKAVREYYPHIVRLLTTAYTDLEDAIEAINRGEILRYIQKPWDIGTLKTELAQAMNYFQLRSERDSLLEEKLSVKQRMVQIERITQLLLVAEAMPYLRSAGQAVCSYLDQLVSARSQPAGLTAPDDYPRLDIWDQTLAETARMQHFVRAINTAVASHVPASTEFNTRLDQRALQSLLQEVAAAAQMPMTASVGQSMEIAVAEPLFRLMLARLFAVISSLDANKNPVAIGMSAAADSGGPAAAMHIAFELGDVDLSPLRAVLVGPATRPIPALCSDLLVAFLACHHHGGTLEIVSKAGHAGFVLVLPTNPALAKPAPVTPNWLEKVLISFEPDF